MNAKKRGGNRGAGAALLVISIAAFIAYAYFLFGSQYSLIVIQITALAAVGVLLAVLGWIGYTMLTAPREEEEKSPP